MAEMHKSGATPSIATPLVSIGPYALHVFAAACAQLRKPVLKLFTRQQPRFSVPKMTEGTIPFNVPSIGPRMFYLQLEEM